jgi:arachidonate 15-lipoxygenase
MPTAPANPSLPQNDTPAQKAARAAQLAAAQSVYGWGAAATLPGVPVAGSVPKDDEPTLDWFGKLISIGLGIARNQLAVKAAGGPAPAPDGPTTTSARLDAIEASTAEVLRHHQILKSGGIIARLASDAKAGIDALEHAAHRALLDAHARELQDIVEAHFATGDWPQTLDSFRALFNTLPLPAIGWLFPEDDMFARLRVAGPNPMLLKRIDKLPANFTLTAPQYAAVVASDTLDVALGEGRIYLLDYAELAVLAAGSWNGVQKYVYQPMALFAVPPGGQRLVPVAIQCGQDAAANPVFTPAPDADPWGWQIAKTIVQVADGNYHELFAHLARTHLVIEAFTVATHRHLANVHPIWALLVPHFEGTLFINDQAATSLIAAGGPIDHIFGGTIATSQQAAASDRLGFDVWARMLPADLAARGVDDATKLPDFPYRDDALLVWNAIATWAAAYIDTYYTSDADVTGDTELAAWASALAGDGRLTGFGPITTRAALAEICTMVMFTASAQHAAVNFPQKDMMAFAPAVTGAGWAAAPAATGGHSKAEWLTYLPPLPLALEQLNVLVLLGSLHYRPLGDYRSNDYPYPLWFEDPKIIAAGGPLASFQAALAGVDAAIAARNAARQYPYPYLSPSLIPTSINI